MQPRSAAFRLGMLAVLAAAWWGVKAARPAWLSAERDWLRSRPYLSDRSLAVVAASLLAAYAVALLAALYNPRQKRRSYDDAMQRAITLFGLLFIAAVAAALAAAWFFHFDAVVRSIAIVTVIVAVV